MAEARGAAAARTVNNAMAFIILTVWGGGGEGVSVRLGA